ncbi:tRNA-splicing endonuclease subunit Sen34 [Ornithorhynchus anatinus]|uniref:tRNA-splicing endonuclease subunit Sen34 n=1 Tax=Ornithorhynchus anatinus TaxID=9258 RepID=UPI0010A7C0D2|nr:tRNA-splicing endonuclease subunit Sen34 [Ornithorhynchus anatinus]
MLVVEVSGGRALVWGAEAARELRERLGLCGRAAGAPAREPRQNARRGLPLLLLPEEARLLADLGAAALVSAARPRPGPAPPGQAVAAYLQAQEESFREQQALALAERRSRLQGLAQKIAQGRARKRQRRQESVDRSEPAAEMMEAEEEEEEGEAEAGRPEGEPSADHPPTPPLPRTAMLLQLPTARPRPRLAPLLDWRVPSPDWPHAGRPSHELRYRVYRDLWQRGYFLTAGGKFGGDFLVYPGDPLRFHAHFVALCWQPEEPLPLRDLVSAGRLGTNVRKTVLLCSARPDGSVCYTSLEWAGLA